MDVTGRSPEVSGRTLQQRYRIVSVLAHGSRGVTWLCEDLRLPGRRWAIRQVHRGQEADFQQRFEREAAAMSLIHHTNLPVVADYFEEGGDAWLVMELVDGSTVAEHVREVGPYSEREALEIGLTLCDLMVELHRHEPPIYFRNLKPDNVMVNSGGTVKVIDFGLTQPGKKAGPTGYAAPEQGASADGRVDIYSWGATMLHLMSGQPPETALLSARTPATAAILRRCLEPQPSDRYATVVDLRADVSQRLRELGVASGAVPAVRRKGAFEGATPVVLLLIATIVFGIAMLLPRLRSSPTPTPSASTSPIDTEGVEPFRPMRAPAETMTRARELYAQGKWKDTIALLDACIKQAPADAEAHILRENATLRLAGGPLVTIPLIVSLSGVDGIEGASWVQGIALAQAMTNRAGGVNGKKVVVDIYDDGSSTSKCLEIADRLVHLPSTWVVMGPMNSQRTLAVAPLFNGAHVNLVAPTASASKVWEAGPFIFTASESRRPRIAALAHHAVRSGHKRVAGLADGASRLSHEMIEIFRAQLQAEGGTFVDLPPYREDQTDFSAQVDAAVQAAPDMIFFADYRGAPLGRFATQLRARGLQTPICAQTTSMEHLLIDVGGANVDGVLLSESYHPKLDNPKTQAFVADFRQKFGDLQPTYPVAENYDAFNAVVDGLKVAHNAAELEEFFRASGTTRPPFEGVSGRWALGRCLDERPVWLIEVFHGRFRLVGQDAP